MTERLLQTRWDITWNKAGFTSQKEVHTMILLENHVQEPLGQHFHFSKPLPSFA